ncbi:MAG TPA: PIG-L family deacetylase, partial [Firmicutes bacterium]|nr:PIG-L family deacetylase [Bacillota bacterium]
MLKTNGGETMTLQEIIPLPKLEQCKRLLCVQPHPDDNEIGAGATIAKLVHNGCEVVYLTVTDGRIGSNDPKIHPRQLAAIRRKETEASARLLGVSASFFLDFQDGSFISEQAVCRKITDVIREVQPEMVMTVDPFLPYETHYDHRTVGMATAGACMM